MKLVAGRLQSGKALLMAAYLYQQGIGAFVGGEGGHSWGDWYSDLWVHVDIDFERARELLDDFERRAGEEDLDPPANWRCPSCGEALEGVFEACWKCGAERARD